MPAGLVRLVTAWVAVAHARYRAAPGHLERHLVVRVGHDVPFRVQYRHLDHHDLFTVRLDDPTARLETDLHGRTRGFDRIRDDLLAGRIVPLGLQPTRRIGDAPL